MRATIFPQENNIRIDDVPLTLKAEQMPQGVVLDGFVDDPARPINVIEFDGAIGMIQRKSRAPGRVDVEHFIGPAPLAAYKETFDAEAKRLDDVRRKKNAEEELRAQHAAELAAQEAKSKG